MFAGGDTTDPLFDELHELRQRAFLNVDVGGLAAGDIPGFRVESLAVAFGT